MADISEAETSSSDDAADFRHGNPSQTVVPLATYSTGSVPDSHSSEVAGAAVRALEDARQKGHSAGCDGPSAEKSLSGEATAGGSMDTVKSGGRVKFPKPKLDLRALFDYHFRRKKRWKPRRLRERKRTRSKRPKRLRVKLPLEEQRRRYHDRGYRFSFVQKLYKTKDLPLKLVCFYEQGALEGYFRYITKLKYEHHLKKSLAELDAGDELENECLEFREYKYLDDDGPLSPIAETNGEDSGEEDIGVKIVLKISNTIVMQLSGEDSFKSTEEQQLFVGQATRMSLIVSDENWMEIWRGMVDITTPSCPASWLVCGPVERRNRWFGQCRRNLEGKGLWKRSCHRRAHVCVVHENDCMLLLFLNSSWNALHWAVRIILNICSLISNCSCRWIPDALHLS